MQAVLQPPSANQTQSKSKISTAQKAGGKRPRPFEFYPIVYGSGVQQKCRRTTISYVHLLLGAYDEAAGSIAKERVLTVTVHRSNGAESGR